MSDCFCFRNYICLRCEAGTRPKVSRPSGNRKVAQCGTRAGYARHIRLKEPTCDLCKLAQVTAVKAWKAAKG